MDESAIILLAKANILRQVCLIAKLETTGEVKAEVMQGLEKGKENAFYLRQLAREKKIKITQTKKQLAEKLGKDFRLGLGEASVIALCLKQKKPMATDDNKARKVGKILGLQVISSLSFPIILYKKKIIGLEQARIALSVMDREGWFKEDTIREAFDELKKEKR